ncbi:MAG: SDR family oxidoreductase [Eubacterium sp.]|nr:SDR family oxidoreductase [Eubacterium sp.]
MSFKDQLPSYDLTGKCAVVTGAAGGIGFTVAGTLAAAGAKVVIADLNEEASRKAADELKAQGLDAIGLACDVSSKESVEKMADLAEEAYGYVDILINNAGVTIDEKPILDVTEKEWDFVHGIDLKGFYFTSQVFAQRMKDSGKGGSMVNLTSAAGIMTPMYVSVYGAAKTGVKHLTGIMAKEWARWGIRVNAVAPGYVKTHMIDKMLENEKNAKVVMKSIPMRRYAETQDVANVALFLSSEASEYLTGVVIPVDGGMMA